MRNYLVRSSFIYLLFFCTQLNAQDAFRYSCESLQIPTFETVKYRASIDVRDKHLSGILICKQVEHNAVRVVFLNEVGSTFFDITLNEQDYIYHTVMSSLDKKAVKRTLAKDLGMIMARGIYNSYKNISTDKNIIKLKLKRKGTVLYKANTTCKQYVSIDNYGRKKVVSITQEFQKDNSMPETIFVQHHKVNFTINLKLLLDVAE